MKKCQGSEIYSTKLSPQGEGNIWLWNQECLAASSVTCSSKGGGGCRISVLWVMHSLFSSYWVKAKKKKKKNGHLKVGRLGWPPWCAVRSKEKHIWGWVRWALHHMLSAWAGKKVTLNGWGKTSTWARNALQWHNTSLWLTQAWSLGSLFCNQKMWGIHKRRTHKESFLTHKPIRGGESLDNMCYGSLIQSLQLGWAKRQWLCIKNNLEKIRTNPISCPIPT